jgi:hypothetical protein
MFRLALHFVAMTFFSFVMTYAAIKYFILEIIVLESICTTEEITYSCDMRF